VLLGRCRFSFVSACAVTGDVLCECLGLCLQCEYCSCTGWFFFACIHSPGNVEV
jgi:hypothetical protein